MSAVSEETPIVEIASLLERKRIKRVPVMRDGQVGLAVAGSSGTHLQGDLSAT